jgi:FkbM family methyltransferase
MSLILSSVYELPKNCRVAVFGAGRFGRAFWRHIRLMRQDVERVFFIDDGNIESKEFKVVKSEEVKCGMFDVMIVACRNAHEIAKRWNGLGFDARACVIDFDYHFFDFNGEVKSGIERMRTRLLSDVDKELFDTIVSARLNGVDVLKKYWEEKKLEQYRQYLQFIDFSTVSTVIEGGVLDGENSWDFVCLSKDKKVRIYGFEPFIENYENGIFKERLEKSGFVRIEPLALWDKEEEIIFTFDDYGVKHYEEGDSEFVQACDVSSANKKVFKTISIDCYCKKNEVDKIDLIKMDIEGAEPQALEGAREIISAHKPYLAICIYHQPEHLYKIADLILDISPEYTFRIGHYYPGFQESVLYAIPNDRL